MMDRQYLIMAVCLMAIWMGIMLLVYLKLEEITIDPCSICSRRMGEQVKCTLHDSVIPLSMDFYPNGTINKQLYPKLDIAIWPS